LLVVLKSALVFLSEAEISRVQGEFLLTIAESIESVRWQVVF
jgi:hypothetical protein